MTITALPSLRHASVDAVWQERTAWANGRRVQFFTVGEGPEVLFLHGWGVAPGVYKRSLHHLAANGFKVIAPALPGFGDSEALPLHAQGVHGVARHLVVFLDALDCDPLPVVGHSLGGAVALRLAAIRSEKVTSATLITPAGGADKGAVSMSRMLGGMVLDARHKFALPAMREFAHTASHHLGALIASGLSAWHAVAAQDLRDAHGAGVRVRLVFASADRIVAQGSLPEVVAACGEGAEVLLVQGEHSWPLRFPERFAGCVADHVMGLGEHTQPAA